MAQSTKGKEFLSRAETVLQQVEEADIFKTVTQRQFPTFERSELGLGPILGVGGTCCVREIAATRLKPDNSAHCKLKDQITNNDIDDKEDEHGLLESEFAHYDVTTARNFIANHCLRNGEARYAVKKLRTDLSNAAKAYAILDLAIEAKILTVISHPNIIKMRGLAEGDPLRKDYFVILDRLYGTLTDKMEKWKTERNKHKGFLRIGENKLMLNKLILDRLLTAYDLAAAFRYLHGHNMLYRDTKPENIGFDVRGDVKLFDFGLIKPLRPERHRGDGLYKLTARTGTRPYMAPEVALANRYGKAADAFSYAILLWEILSLKSPFEGLNDRAYHRQVIQGGERLPISELWPSYTQKIMTDCFSHNPRDRQSFEQIISMLQADLASFTGDDNVLHRDSHMMLRSERSRAESNVSHHSQHSIDGREGFEMMKNGSFVPV